MANYKETPNLNTFSDILVAEPIIPIMFPAEQSDLAQQLTKDPYIIDAMGIRPEMDERDIEVYLDSNISKYLLELGKGFTYYGHQVPVKVGEDNFYIDQLFHHVKLHCYVVVELKTTKFRPERILGNSIFMSQLLTCNSSQCKTTPQLVC